MACGPGEKKDKLGRCRKSARHHFYEVCHGRFHECPPVRYPDGQLMRITMALGKSGPYPRFVRVKGQSPARKRKSPTRKRKSPVRKGAKKKRAGSPARRRRTK